MKAGMQILKGALLPPALALALLVGQFWPASVCAVLYVHSNPIAFQWEAATGAIDHYNVYLSVDQKPFVLHNEIALNSCSISISDGSRYVVQVEAESSLGMTGPLSDPSEEIVVYLNGSADDTDGDGMTDVWEVSYGFNPFNPADGSEDPDSDGLSNSGEFLAGTIPTNPDSDQDGVLDGTEVLNGQNPLSPVDNVPVANAGADQQLDPTVVILDGSASLDPNGDPLTFSWSQEQGFALDLSDAHSPRPTFLGRKWGDYRFRLVVNDGRVDSSPDDVTITIRNVRPTADAGPDQVVDAGTQVLLDSVGSQDSNGDTLSFSWTQLDGPPVSLSGANTQRASLVPLSAGVYCFQLVVSDGLLSSTPDQVQITVNSFNQVPTAQASDDQIVNVNDSVTLDGSRSTDPDGDALGYTWSQMEDPETVALDGTSTAQARFVPSLAGGYRFQLVVSDGKVSSAPDEVIVTAIDENHPPVAVVTAVAPVVVGGRVTLDGAASYDPDGDPLTYRWTQTEGPLVALENVDSRSAGFYAIAEGVSRFELVVRDGELASAPALVEVTVDGVNQVPVADAGEDLQGLLKKQVCLDGRGSYDPDAGDILTYGWSQVAGPRMTLYAADTATPCFTPRNSGDYQFELVVCDGDVQSPPDRVTVTVPDSRSPRPAHKPK